MTPSFHEINPTRPDKFEINVKSLAQREGKTDIAKCSGQPKATKRTHDGGRC
jgi:hypothetical protein